MVPGNHEHALSFESFLNHSQTGGLTTRKSLSCITMTLSLHNSGERLKPQSEVFNLDFHMLGCYFWNAATLPCPERQPDSYLQDSLASWTRIDGKCLEFDFTTTYSPTEYPFSGSVKENPALSDFTADHQPQSAL
jgi:hypothetical protein